MEEVVDRYASRVHRDAVESARWLKRMQSISSPDLFGGASVRMRIVNNGAGEFLELSAVGSFDKRVYPLKYLALDSFPHMFVTVDKPSTLPWACYRLTLYGREQDNYDDIEVYCTASNLGSKRLWFDLSQLATNSEETVDSLVTLAQNYFNQ